MTRVPPTARDVFFMQRLANRKWNHSYTTTEPFAGTRVDIFQEIVFQPNGHFTFQQLMLNYTSYGFVASYPGYSEGRWWVQNNGRLVMHATSYSGAAEYQFMTLRSINGRRFVSSDNGTWIKIGRNTTRIPGPL